MKKLFLFCAVGYLFSTCSTDLDILDNWKETTVVYCLLDQSQPKQYVRIEKAFLGPDNAMEMAQNYDSINYINQLEVWLQELDNNGNIVNYFQLAPDTITNKDTGFFYAPDYVLYSMTNPAFNTTHPYHLIVKNNSTGNTANATTSLISDFTITRPLGPTIGIVKTNANSMVEVKWTGSQQARIYQVAIRFHYIERDLSNNITYKVTPDWIITTMQVDSANAPGGQETSFDPNAFYKNLVTVIPANPNVVARQSDYLEVAVFGGGEELQTYMAVNGPSTSLVQEKPVYTNINNGLGLFASRYQKIKTNLTLTPQTVDTLSMGQFSCQLLFLNRNQFITNIADLPPGCQ